jgi:hypothetical protein
VKAAPDPADYIDLLGDCAMESEAEYLLKRASDESRKAISSDLPEVADAHEELAIRYSAKAVTALSVDDEPASE